MPNGSLNAERKPGLVADVTEAIMRIEPRERWRADPNCVWCIVNDVPDGDWGAGGRILTLRDLVAMFGENLAPERQASSTSADHARRDRTRKSPRGPDVCAVSWFRRI